MGVERLEDDAVLPASRVSRSPSPCGKVHRAGPTGRRPSSTCPALRCSRLWFLMRDGSAARRVTRPATGFQAGTVRTRAGWARTDRRSGSRCRALAAGGTDLLVDQALKLVGDGLLGHADRGDQVARADFAAAVDGVQQPQPGVVAQHLEQVGQPSGLARMDQRAVREGRGARGDRHQGQGGSRGGQGPVRRPALMWGPSHPHAGGPARPAGTGLPPPGAATPRRSTPGPAAGRRRR